MAWDNRKRIQIARGTSASVSSTANKNIKVADGQPILIKDKHYLEFGIKQGTAEQSLSTQLPIRSRTIQGWFADSETFGNGSSDTFTHNKYAGTYDDYSGQYILSGNNDGSYLSTGKNFNIYKATETNTEIGGDDNALFRVNVTNDQIEIPQGKLLSSKMVASEIAYLNNDNTPGGTHITLDNTHTIINKTLRLTDNKIYTNDKKAWTLTEVEDTFVGLTQSQNITGKTYNGLSVDTWSNKLKISKDNASITTTASYTLGSACQLTKPNQLTGTDNISWTDKAIDEQYAVTRNDLGYWNGRYNSSSSRLQYCDRGRFGTIITKNSGDYILTAGSENNKITGNLAFSNTGDTAHTGRGIYGIIGTNDDWVIRGSQTAQNAGYLEIATGDDGQEPIYVVQYGGAGGSVHCFDTSMANSNKRVATLLDASGNTSFPGHLTAASMETGTLKCTTINLITT